MRLKATWGGRSSLSRREVRAGLRFILNYVSVYGCVHVCVGTCGGQRCGVPLKVELQAVVNSFPTNGCGEPNLGPPQGQQAFVNTEPAL